MQEEEAFDADFEEFGEMGSLVAPIRVMPEFMVRTTALIDLARAVDETEDNTATQLLLLAMEAHVMKLQRENDRGPQNSTH